MTDREKIINDYIEGYNEFNINKIVLHFSESIIFQNISNGEINTSLTGLIKFKEQAEKAKTYFSTRKQTIKSFKHNIDEIEIEIDYFATLKIDFPNGLKKGEELNLGGKSIFKFSGNKIIMLTDIS